MKEDHLVSLIVRYWSGELDSPEVWELEEWAMLDSANRQLLDRVLNEEDLRKEISQWRLIDSANAYNSWLEYWKTRRKARIARISGWLAAASLLTTVIVIGLIQKSGSPEPARTVAKEVQVTVLPGRNKATLTLANGRQILLDSVGRGQLAMEGNTRLVKVDTGSLSYIAARGNSRAIENYNILTTPRSGQYRLILPDGSRVWLNNVSSLRYPTSFDGKERVVELAGEAYFEVAKDVSKPFIVRSKDVAVQVLGTKFNIMAYPEEGGTQTTLLDGEVRVNTGVTTVELKPDEQAQVIANSGLRILRGVPSEDIASWKDGFFYFNRASFSNMMRQVARWYDVDIVYQGKEPDMEFEGKIDRAMSLNDLLKFLDKNQIRFRLEGRKLIVLPS